MMEPLYKSIRDGEGNLLELRPATPQDVEAKWRELNKGKTFFERTARVDYLYPHGWRCSNCGVTVFDVPRYCHYCGARFLYADILKPTEEKEQGK